MCIFIPPYHRGYYKAILVESLMKIFSSMKKKNSPKVFCATQLEKESFIQDKFKTEQLYENLSFQDNSLSALKHEG